MYKQKGTGNALVTALEKRPASSVGGGRVHGPEAARLRLQAHAQDAQGRAQERPRAQAPGRPASLVIDDFDAPGDQDEEPRCGILETSSRSRRARSSSTAPTTQNLRLSARNLAKHQFLPPEGVNVYDVLRHEHLILTKGAVAALEAPVQVT